MMLHMHMHMHMHNWVELWRIIENKLEVNSHQRNVTCDVTQLLLAATFLSEIIILRSTTVRKVTKFSRILVFKVSPDCVWMWA
jgi:hypothetical protein